MNTTNITRVRKLARKCRNQRDAVRLWNVIDCQDECEAMWYGMMITIPWAFANTASFMSIKAA